jgi:signal peptidase I
LVFSRLSSKINIRRFIGASITSLVLHFVLFLVFALSFTFTSGIPYYIATDKFEPELQKGERVITRKNFDSLAVGEFVIFLGSNGKTEGGTRPTVGKVIQLTPDLLLDTNNGPVTVKKEELLGVVIKSEFNIGKDFFSFFAVTVTPDDIEEK